MPIVSGFNALSAGNRNWTGIAIAPNGNVYASTFTGDIYMQNGGSGAFNFLSTTLNNSQQMAAAPNGNVYLAINATDIYMQTNGAGAFGALSAGDRNWIGMAAAPNGDVYASVQNGDIYMQTNGAGAFNALSAGNRNWFPMAAASNGNIYAGVYGGDIYMQTNGAGAFNALSAGNRNWTGIAIAPNGNIYAGVYGGDIYMQTNGAGAFNALSAGNRNWRGMAAAPNGDVYTNVFNGDIYLQTTTYALTYSANGSTGGAAPAATNHKGTDTVTLALNTGSLVKSGYRLTGWNTLADGTGTHYDLGGAYTMPFADTTIYAEWKLVYTVTYNGNGNTSGAVPTDATEYLPGETVTVLGQSTLLKTGHVFDEWNTVAGGTGTGYDEGDTFAIGAAYVTLYAIWTPLYTVTYNGNGNTSGAVPVDATFYFTGDNATILTNSGNLLKTGFVYTGWNSDGTGLGTHYVEGQIVPMTVSLTLYAEWLKSPEYVMEDAIKTYLLTMPAITAYVHDNIYHDVNPDEKLEADYIRYNVIVPSNMPYCFGTTDTADPEIQFDVFSKNARTCFIVGHLLISLLRDFKGTIAHGINVIYSTARGPMVMRDTPDEEWFHGIVYWSPEYER